MNLIAYDFERLVRIAFKEYLTADLTQKHLPERFCDRCR